MWGSGSYSPRSVPPGQSRGTRTSRANQEDGAYKLLGFPQETAPSRCLVDWRWATLNRIQLVEPPRWQPAWFCTYLIRVSRGASPQESIEYPSRQKTLLPP